MPLLGKVPFRKHPTPPGLQPNDEVFVCKATDEIFTDYEKFFEQIILCNSLIWTCKVTGRTGLTFAEALESEKKCKNQIENFPESLHRPVLLVASQTGRSIFREMIDDVYGFCKDRYFVGEKVIAVDNGEKRVCIISKVILNSLTTSPSKIKANKLVEISENSSNNATNPYSDPSKLCYLVKEKSSNIKVLFPSKDLSRGKNKFSRDIIKLFLKENCEHKSKGVWKIKEMTKLKYKLQDFDWNDFFLGPIPIFPKSEELLLESISPNKTSDSSASIIPAIKKEFSDSPSNNLKNDLVQEKDKIPKKDSLLKKKEQEKKKQELLREWHRPRDDMQCDDLKDLPRSVPITCLPDHFDLALSVFEFLINHKTFCNLDLPEKFIFEDFLNSLTYTESDGLYSYILQQLLSAFFQMQISVNRFFKSNNNNKNNNEMQANIMLLSFFESHSKKTKSLQPESPLQNLPLDISSLTEVVRLHLITPYMDNQSYQETLCNGTNEGVDTGKHFIKTSEFLTKHPQIIKKLIIGNVLDLLPSEKLEIISHIHDQIISSLAFNDYIEDCYQKLKVAQKDLRTHVWAVQKREKDLINYNLKKKLVQETDEPFKKIDEKESTHKKSIKSRKSNILSLKDKDFEEMPLEGIDWDQMSCEEKEHIKNWSIRREKELSSIAESLECTCYITSIGLDRTFRKYWIFPNIPGLFIEDHDDFIRQDDCLVPIHQDLNKIKTIKSYFEMTNSSSSPLPDNPNVNAINCLKSNSVKGVGTNTQFIPVQEQIATRGNIRWSFYSHEEDVDNLISRLNPRGHREGNLRNYLILKKEKIISSLKSCNISPLTKPDMNTAFNGMVLGENELAKSLIDLLLDLEDRIFVGNLGELKLCDRNHWRNQLIESINDQSPDYPIDLIDSKVCEDDTNFNELKHKCQLQHLTESLINIQEMIDPKYLNPPLGDGDNDAKFKKQKASADMNEDSQESQHNNGNPQTKILETWCQRVLICSNFSQLYICLYALDSSIAWSKSSLNARCRICRKKKDGENMLLCDGCDQGHHMYCLKPPLKKIPEGDWFCPWCRPKDLIHLTPRKSNPKYKDYSSSEEDQSTEEQDHVYDNKRIKSDNLSVTSSENNKDAQNGLSDDDSFDKKKIKISEKTKKKQRNDTKIKSTTRSNSTSTLGDTDFEVNDTPNENQNSIIKKLSRSGRQIKPKNSTYDQENNKNKRLSYFEENNISSDRKNLIMGLNDTVETNNSSIEDYVFLESLRSNNSLGKRNRKSLDDKNLINVDSENKKRKRKLKSKLFFEEERQFKKRSTPSKNLNGSMSRSLKVIEDLVTELMKRDEAWPFCKPVTVKEAPDYFNIIKRPIDLATIKYKIYRFEYENSDQILDDLRLMFDNCNLYNQPNSIVQLAGQTLEDYLDQRLADIDSAVNLKNVSERMAKRISY